MSSNGTRSGADADDPVAGLHEKLDRILGEHGEVRRLALGGRVKYGLDAAAVRLGVSRRTVERRIDQGELVSVREGGRRFVTESACRDYEDRARRRP